MAQYAALDAPAGAKLRAAIGDLRRGQANRPFWWMLAWQQVNSQYRRTVLGPWWITLQAVVFVAGLTLLFGILLQRDIRTFLPYVAAGFILFSFMTGCLMSGTTAFVSGASTITSSPVPLSCMVYRGVSVNLIQLGHDLIPLAALLVIVRVPVSWTLVVFPVALLLVILNAIAAGLWLAPLAARYRDVQPLMSAIVRVLFFFTPVFWTGDEMSRAQVAVLAGWNPLAYLLDAMRAPLIGAPLEPMVYLGTLVVTIVNVLLGVTVFAAMRSRVPYLV